jgi:hypothetical protein
MQAMTFNKQGIGEFMRLDSSGNIGIGTQFGVSNRIWSAEPAVLNSWRILTSDPAVVAWLDQHAHRGSDAVGWPEWTLTQDLYVMFLLRWGDQ